MRFFWYSNKCCKVESSALLTVAIFSMSKQFSPFPAQYWDQLSSKVFSSSSHKDYLQIENRLLLWIIHYFHHHELHITILFTKMKRERELFLSSPSSSLFCVSISFNFASELKLLFDVFHPCFFVGCLSKSYRVAAALHKSKISQANFSSLFYTSLKLSAKYFFISIQTLRTHGQTLKKPRKSQLKTTTKKITPQKIPQKITSKKSPRKSHLNNSPKNHT